MYIAYRDSQSTHLLRDVTVAALVEMELNPNNWTMRNDTVLMSRRLGAVY